MTHRSRLRNGLLPALLVLSATGLPAETRAPDSQAPLRLPAERVLSESADSPGPVVFRHTTHVALQKNSCLGCHPETFKLLSRTFRGRHADMDAGRTCGRCHDGKAAFATKDENACGRCHAASTPVDPLARSIGLARGAESPGRVVFSHRTHAAAAGRCSACHPAPFAESVSARPRPAGAMHEKSACGRCHDGRAAFSVEERCDGCHREEAGR